MKMLRLLACLLLLTLPVAAQNNPDIARTRAVNPLALAAAGAGTFNSSVFSNLHHRGVHCVVNITGITGTTPTFTVVIEGRDHVSGNFYTLLSSAALTAQGTTVLRVYPGITAAANLAVSDALPPLFRVRGVVAGTTPAVSATVGCGMLL